jgi:hypothetical protein
MDTHAQSKTGSGPSANNMSEGHHPTLDEPAAVQGACPQVHLPTGAICIMRHGHVGSCDFSPAGQVDALLATRKTGDPAVNASVSALGRESEALRHMSIGELVAELTILQDRQYHESPMSGHRPLPGQTQRRAALERRERRIVAELERRHTERRARETV